MPPQKEHSVSKKEALIAAGFILIGTFALGLIPARWFGIKPPQQQYAKIDLSSVGVDDVANDTNNDGSISWKELAEGSLDPAALAEMEGQKADPEVLKRLDDSNNLTSSFSKNLYLASAYLAKNNVSDAATQENTISGLIKEEAGKIVMPSYTSQDIHTSGGDDALSLKLYGNAVATVLGPIISTQTISDTAGSMQAYLETKDASALAPLKEEQARVQTKLTKLETLSVPPSAATLHTEALTKLGAYNELLLSLANIETDPLRSALMIEKYASISVDTLSIFVSMKDYFDAHNVAFSSKEAGYVFKVGYTLQ
ncbi:MAG: hypothetical protein RIQ41_163 [Candidatus Parcubacteria bacterium]|jgi:hypothetical protein